MKFYDSFPDRYTPCLTTKVLRIMKLTLFLFFIALMQVHAVSKAQNVTLSEKNVSLARLFKDIKDQTGVKFLYNPDMLEKGKKVSIEVINQPLKQVLDACFQNQPLSYTLFEGNIVVKEKEPSVIDRIKAAFESLTVQGTVSDDQNRPLPGVTVKEKGTDNIVVTDTKGDYKITVKDKNAVLTFSFIGYDPQEIVAKNLSTPGLVVLKPSTLNLKEVVINKGYYNTTRELNTGNVSSVSAKTISQQPVSNPLAALEGQVPGLFITQTSGAPGGGFIVQIRGQNSIANGNDAFYVIDGVPYTSSPQLQANNNINPAGGNPLNFLNPADIESIEVLKDADATAIYGSRGANGVILITTKKGKAGTQKIDFNVYEGVGKVTRTVKYLNTPQYLEIRNEAFKNDGASPDPGYDYDVLGGNGWDTTRTVDWQKMLIGNTAHYTDAQGSISGGDEFTQYLIGGGYHRETSVYPGQTSDQKASAHVSLSTESKNKRFKITFSGNYLADQTSLPDIDLTQVLTFLSPDTPNPRNADGSLNWANSTWGLDGNPLAFEYQPYKGHTDNLVSNVVLSYHILKGLDFTTNAGYTNTRTDEKLLNPLSSIDPGEGLTSGSSLFNNTSSHSWIIEPQLNYKLTKGKSSFNALIGTTFQQNTYSGTNILAQNFSSDALISDPQAASSITYLAATDILYKYNALYGRLNYTYDDRYIVNLTARRDGSSRFGPGKQFADFGAIGAAWLFTKEKWTENWGFLSSGKLRASYGTSGNDQIPDYSFLDQYKPTSYPYGVAQGIYPKNFYNPDLAWEVNKKIEAGLELGFLQNRLLFTASYYRNRSSNQLLPYALSAVTGFSSIQENLPATVQNTGLELMLNAVIVKTNDFRWSSSVNLTVPRNKLIAFPGLATSSYSNQFIIGQPLTILKTFKYEGVDPQTGLYQFMGKDGQLTSEPIPLTDQINIVNTAPTLYGGYQNSFTYKHFSLDFFLQFVKQTGYNFLYNDEPGAINTSEPVTVLNRWQKPGDNSTIQRFNQDGSVDLSSADATYSNLFYRDASYIRLKNLSFSYSIPVTWARYLGLQNGRLYLQGQNLLTITKFIGYDPENQSTQALPPLKVFTMGLQVTL